MKADLQGLNAEAGSLTVRWSTVKFHSGNETFEPLTSKNSIESQGYEFWTDM
jgi:hypothetical protein